MKKISTEFLYAVLTCFLICTAYSNIQSSCNMKTDQVAKGTVHTSTMETTSDWKSTDLCVCRLSTPLESSYLTFGLLVPPDEASGAICGPYITVTPISDSLYHVCPRSQSSPRGSTVWNQSNITIALWSRDSTKSLPGANISIHSYIPITLTCRIEVNLENTDCPCDVHYFASPQDTEQPDFDLSTRSMRGFVIGFSILFVCGLLLLFFLLNKRFHYTERLKRKIPLFSSAAANSTSSCGSVNSAFETSNSYDELPATVNAQPIDDPNYEMIRQLPNTNKAPNKCTEKAEMGPALKSLNGSNTSGIYEEIPHEKLPDVGSAALGETSSVCPYAASSDARNVKAPAHLVGRGALSTGDICRWKYSPPFADHVMTRNVKISLERSRKEPETEVIYGTVNKLKLKSGNDVRAEPSASKQDGLSLRLGKLDNDTFVS